MIDMRDIQTRPIKPGSRKDKGRTRLRPVNKERVSDNNVQNHVYYLVKKFVPAGPELEEFEKQFKDTESLKSKLEKAKAADKNVFDVAIELARKYFELWKTELALLEAIDGSFETARQKNIEANQGNLAERELLTRA